jgi:hypothetical protein
LQALLSEVPIGEALTRECESLVAPIVSAGCDVAIEKNLKMEVNAAQVRNLQ